MKEAKKRLKINKAIVRTLRNAMGAARLDNCAVNKEHQRAMKLYIQTWIEAPLRNALMAIEGREYEEPSEWDRKPHLSEYNMYQHNNTYHRPGEDEEPIELV